LASLLEGVEIYTAACAATTLIHYTPPPFDERIVPLMLNGCQALTQNSFVRVEGGIGSCGF